MSGTPEQVDYVKVDWCGSKDGHSAEELHTNFSEKFCSSLLLCLGSLFNLVDRLSVVLVCRLAYRIHGSASLPNGSGKWLNATGRPIHLELCRGYTTGRCRWL